MKLAFLFNKENWLRLSLLFLLVFIPFNTKKFIYAFTGRIEDFLSVFLYASDIFLFLFLILFLVVSRHWPPEDLKINKIIFICLILFLTWAGFSIFWADYPLAAFYRFIRLLMLAAGALVIAVVLKKKIIDFKIIAVVVAGSAVFQSLIALYQFVFSHSVGWWWLGEPLISLFRPGGARFFVNDEAVLRSFGTLPHANILAAFLVLGLISFGYLWLKSRSFSGYLVIGLGIFIILTALVVTFSRSGWLSFVLAFLLITINGLINRQYRLITVSLFLLFGVLIGILMIYFNDFIFARAHFPASDASIIQRQAFNQIGWHIIKTNFSGVGLANQVFYAADNNLYQQFGMNRKNSQQPIHNLYLLIGSELGWIGLILFFVFLFFVFRAVVLNQRIFVKPEIAFPIIMFITFLALGLVDHYFWDLQSGMLMFWLILGIIINISPRSSTDRTLASGAGNGSSNLPEDANSYS